MDPRALTSDAFTVIGRTEFLLRALVGGALLRNYFCKRFLGNEFEAERRGRFLYGLERARFGFLLVLL